MTIRLEWRTLNRKCDLHYARKLFSSLLIFFLIAIALRDVYFLHFNSKYATIYLFFPPMDVREIPLIITSTKLIFLQFVEVRCYEYDAKASLN